MNLTKDSIGKPILKCDKKYYAGLTEEEQAKYRIDLTDQYNIGSVDTTIYEYEGNDPKSHAIDTITLAEWFVSNLKEAIDAVVNENTPYEKSSHLDTVDMEVLNNSFITSVKYDGWDTIKLTKEFVGDEFIVRFTIGAYNYEWIIGEVNSNITKFKYVTSLVTNNLDETKLNKSIIDTTNLNNISGDNSNFTAFGYFSEAEHKPTTSSTEGKGLQIGDNTDGLQIVADLDTDKLYYRTVKDGVRQEYKELATVETLQEQIGTLNNSLEDTLNGY